MLKDPVTSKVPFLLQANNITRNQLLYHLKSQGLINRHEKICDKDSQGNPKTAKMIIRYSVPKKDFAKKMKKLFIDLVAKNVPKKIEKQIAECEGGDGATAFGTADCSGQFSQPLFGVQRRKMPTDLEEETTASNVTSDGDISMGISIPFGTDKETKDRTPGFSVQRQDESINLLTQDIDEYMYEYGVEYVLNSFLNSGKGSKQNWGVLINPSMYQKALSEFIQFGKIEHFPTKRIYQWMGIIMRNTCILAANTYLAGHSSGYPYEEIEDFAMSYLGDKFYDMHDHDILIRITEKEFLSLCNEKHIYLNESNGIHKDGQYDLFMNQKECDEYDEKMERIKNRDKFQQYKEMADEYNSKSVNCYGISLDKIGVNINQKIIYRVQSISIFLDDTGLYDYMVMPDGSDAWSDYGLQPIFNLISQYDENESTPEQTLVLINKILDVYHQRGDISSIFITGGSKALSQISGY